MLIHDFDVFRWILGDEAQTLHATGSCLTDSAVHDAGDIDSTAVTIRTRRGLLCQINTSRRAAYGYDQRFELLGNKGMLQAGNVRPTEVSAWLAGGIATDVPEPFFLNATGTRMRPRSRTSSTRCATAHRSARRSTTGSPRSNWPRPR